MLTLNRMHELLQACTAQEEAYQVISLVAGELSPDKTATWRSHMLRIGILRQWRHGARRR